MILHTKIYAENSGSVGANPVGPLYDPGTVVTLTATPTPGSGFEGWTGCDSISVDGDCVVTMAAARTVTAEFAMPKPVITATNPPSPANNNLPRVMGTLPSGGTLTDVKLYTNGNCSGTPVAKRTPDKFTGDGIPVTVPDNSTTTFSVSVKLNGVTTPCSNPFVYVEDSAALPKPVITGTDPPSPANDNLPRVKGTLPSGGTLTEVKLYTNGNCSGTPVAKRDPVKFTGAGIPVTVPDNSTTTFSVSVKLDGVTTPCSDSLVYVEDSTAP